MRRLSCAFVSVSAVVALATSCATAPKTTAPKLTTVPSIVVEAFCTKLRSEGIASDAELHVVRTAQPLVNGPSLESLSHLYFKSGDAGGPAQVLGGTTPQVVPVDFANAHSCGWTGVDRLDPLKHAQLTIVEFSVPFVNPFTHGESGVFVRMSIGGHDAQWYWIPLAERNGQLGVGLVLALDLHDA